ncbi:MAG: tetratricopeptide repeat protein [Saprospiraceae bacterium]|nr:tetratricopeptide repeat protein [Saprospiraceae bacterium]
MKAYLVFVLLGLSAGFGAMPLLAQSTACDSLLLATTAGQTMPDDTATLEPLFKQASQCGEYSLENGLRLYRHIYAIARRLQADTWLARLEVAIGRTHANLGAPDSAMAYFTLAQQRFEKQGDMAGLANVYTKIRWVHSYLGNNEKAAEFAFKALALYEKLNDEVGTAQANNYIADILYAQEKWEASVQYAEKAYQTQRKLNLREDLACSAQAMGDTWLQLRDYPKELAYQDEALAIRRQLGSDIDLGLSLNSRGNVLKYLKRYPEALKSYQEALQLAIKTDFTPLRTSCTSNIGHIYNLLGEYKKALPYHLQIRQAIQELFQLDKAEENYRLLAEAYAGIGRFDSAYFFLQLNKQTGDSLLNEENTIRMSELQTQYETAQKEARIVTQAQQLDRERSRFWAVLVGLAGALLAGGLLWRLTRQLQRRNEEKEFLIKEIHHRVKNNLQVLSSLLHLQSRQITDETALDAVREGQNRVDAMGLIHQKLYMGDNIAAVDMADYTRHLGDMLLESFGLAEGRVQLRYAIQPLRLDVDTAVPLGLIINELLTNALKYAFPEGRAGQVDIALWQDETGKLRLEVSDNGVGKAAAPVLKGSTAFGTNLIQMLSKKLKGSIQVAEGSGGYATRMAFENIKYIL